MSAPKPRVLFVDDEPLVLEAIAARLRREYEVVTATSGRAALELIDAGPPFAVVVSDMRMPGMDGAAFLARVRERSPDATRMLLTGYSDLDDAIRAINDGHVFRILTKPCPHDALSKALVDALEQRRLVTQDKDLLERKLSELSGQLLHAERLATIGTMTAGVAHELNNISAVFLSALGEIKEDAQDGRLPDPRALADLARVGQHLRAHAQQILYMGRPGPRADRTYDARELVEGTLSMLRTAGKTKHIVVETEAPKESVEVIVDRTRFEQIFVNLVGNAADAVAEQPPARKRITVSVEALPGGGGAITIADQGCGIAADKLGSIFEPYFTTKPVGKGTGLGLPVVKQIVESYGGLVSVESRQGEGTRFRVELPATGRASTPTGPVVLAPESLRTSEPANEPAPGADESPERTRAAS